MAERFAVTLAILVLLVTVTFNLLRYQVLLTCWSVVTLDGVVELTA